MNAPQQPGGWGVQGVGAQSSGQAIQQPLMQQPQLATTKKARRKVLTSLTLQIFVFFGACWDVFYFILNILVFVYKGVNLPYFGRNFAMEFCFSWFWIFIEIPRLFLISKGNKTEKASPMFYALALALPLAAMYAYFVEWQTYVLKIDQVLNGVALFFLGVQVILSFIYAIRFIFTKRFVA